MHELTYSALNDLLGASFDMNAQADNFAYNLSKMQYNKMSDIVHHSYAHAFPVEFADAISDEMLLLDVRPIRKPGAGFDEEYTDINKIFEDNVGMIMKYQKQVLDTIDIAEYNGDVSVKIFLEDFLVHTVDKFAAQALEWYKSAQRYDPIQLNVHFAQLTTKIALVD
jgi:hypothetical protein